MGFGKDSDDEDEKKKKKKPHKKKADGDDDDEGKPGAGGKVRWGILECMDHAEVYVLSGCHRIPELGLAA